MVVLWNAENEESKEYDEAFSSLMVHRSYTKNRVKLDLDLKNHESPHVKPSLIEPPQLKLKPFPSHL